MITDESNLPLLEEKWLNIINNLKEANFPINKFIRYYWISKYNHITERKIYRSINKEINDYDFFLKELIKSANILNNYLINLDDSFLSTDYFKDPFKYYDYLNNIKRLNISQCYVLLLSIFRNSSCIDRSLVSIFENIEKFSFVYFTVCKLPANKVEKIYSKTSIQLDKVCNNNYSQKDRLKEISRLFEEFNNDLKKNFPSLEVFKESFNNIEYKNNSSARIIIKYIFDKIEWYSSSGEKRIDFNNVNIEHIYPQKPSNDWLKLKEEKYINNIGNLTIIHKNINSAAGNKNINYKMTLFKNSEFIINKKIVEFIESKNNLVWDDTAILNRHNEICYELYKIMCLK